MGDLERTHPLAEFPASLDPPAVLAADVAELAGSVFLPLAVLAILVVVGWFAIARIRRWMAESSEASEGFTLEDLRRLRRQGEISEDEFQRAHAQMISVVRSAPSRADAPSLAPTTRGPKETREAREARLWLERTVGPSATRSNVAPAAPGAEPERTEAADAAGAQPSEPRAAPTAPESPALRRPADQTVVRDTGHDRATGKVQPPVKPRGPLRPDSA